MKRCSKCIMPETAKGITFDNNGLCSLCRGYKEYVPRGEEELRREIAPYVQGKQDFNCIVPLSGGRDSTYTLYYATCVLGLKPIAVHNDNDFETEIATRNLAVTTARLGVPLIRVRSKDGLSRKIVVEKFKMNAPFGARLVVGQTCEACQIGFESAAYNAARKHGIQVILWGDSRDESTAPYHALVGKQPLPKYQRYLSPSVVNLLTYKYYMMKMKMEYGPHSPLGLKEIHFYDFIRWDQRVIVETIQDKLGWSAPPDSPTTWRIDCSLVPMVNYLTEQAYGVSKIELGFSNMVRSGKMEREDALRRVEMIKRGTDVGKLKTFLSGIGVPETSIRQVIN